MRDAEVSVCSIAAWGLWALAALLLAASWLTGDLHVASVGLALSAAAATATIRSYFICQADLMRAAFDLGRESAGGRVQRLR